MSKCIDRGESDVAFQHTKGDAGLLSEGEDGVDVFQVGFEVGGVDNDVVDVDESDLPFVATKDLVHKVLEDSRSILETERHELPLVKPTVSAKGRLGFGIIGERDLVKTLIGVEGREPLHTVELGENVVDSG